MPRYSRYGYGGSPMRQLVVGVALVVIGLAITIGTYANASNGGGTYVISFGPIIFGALRIVTAIPALIRQRQGQSGPARPGGAPPWGNQQPGAFGPGPGPGGYGGPGSGPGYGGPGPAGPGYGPGPSYGPGAPAGPGGPGRTPPPASWGGGHNYPPQGGPVGASAQAGTSPAAVNAQPASASLPAAAWYEDPSDSSGLRWWDGTAWSEHTRPR